jgi:copper chaperone
MEKTSKLVKIQIDGMHCEHCVKSIKSALSEIKGIESADVDLKGGFALIKGFGFDIQTILTAIDELGYTVKGLSA